MTIIHVTEATVGAPNSGRISGTAGDLYAMLKYAAPLNGWAVEYDDAVNFRCVLRPGTGNRFRLYVNDNSTDSGSAARCIVRGCENAAGTLYSDLTDPFPTQAQIADASAVWLKSSAVSTAARLFDLWVGETFIWISIQWNGANWDLQGFGDFAPSLAGDSYNTFCSTRNSTTIGAGATWPNSTGLFTNASGGSSGFWICRSYDGTVKSVRGGLLGKLNQGSIGIFAGAVPAALVGPTSGIDTSKFEIYDSGSGSGTASSSLALPVRGYMPNLLSPLHNGAGTLTARYSYTESPFMATGKVILSAAASNFVVFQESDDWTPPA